MDDETAALRLWVKQLERRVQHLEELVKPLHLPPVRTPAQWPQPDGTNQDPHLEIPE